MSLPEVQVVGSSLKKCHVAPSPLATQMAPLAARGITHSTRGDSVRLTFRLLMIFHSWRLLLDGREVRFNFPGQTCLDPRPTI